MTRQDTAPSTTLLLIRHGQTDANVAGIWQGATDDPLNAIGQAQALAVAARLASDGRQIDAIYSSPLGRTRQTAEAIAQALNHRQPLQIDPGLGEYDLGEWEGLSYEVLRHEKRLWERMAADPHWAPSGGESAVQFVTRTLRTLQGIATRHPGQTVVVVGHGGAIATALAMLLEGAGDRWTSYQMDNCAITELTFDPQPRLVRFNDVKHLS